MKRTARKENRKAKSLMKLYGISGQDVADTTGKSPRTVWVVLGGYGTSTLIQKAIVSLIRKHDPEVEYADLWPENDKAA